MLSIDTCVTENEHGAGMHNVQWQFPMFTINCVSVDLSFAQQILDFVAKTRAKPAFRDKSLGAGMYEYTETSIDLSRCFSDLEFKLDKIGEYDHAYCIRLSFSPKAWILFELHEKILDDFLAGLRDI